ncbi:MAG: carboxypeptidase-like regulatory domain-containing protein [Planctomycetota bacterium]
MMKSWVWILVVAGAGLATWLAWGHRARPLEPQVNAPAVLPSAPDAALDGSLVDRTGLPGLTGPAPTPAAGSRGARLGGTVLEAVTGEPVVGAVVHAVRTKPAFAWRRATTDGTGAFEVDGLAVGSWVVTVWHQAYLVPGLAEAVLAKSLTAIPESQRFDVTTSAASVDSLVLRIQRGSRIEGTVIDEVGASVPHARIRLAGDAISRVRSAFSISVSELELLVAPTADAEGRFVLGCIKLAEGLELTLAATTADRAGRWVEAPAPDDDGVRRVVLESARLATLHGRAVYPDGTPAADVEVAATCSLQTDPWTSVESTASTNATGHFELTRLAPERDGVRLRWPHGDIELAAVRLPALSAGETRRVDDIVVPRVFELDVRLVSSEGAPLAGELLQLVHDDEDEDVDNSDARMTGDLGEVRLSAVGAGPWRVLHVQPHQSTVLRSSLRLPSAPLELTASTTPRFPLRLRLVDASGNVVPEYWVVAWPERAQATSLITPFKEHARGRDGLAIVEAYGPLPVKLRFSTKETTDGLSQLKLAHRIETDPGTSVVELHLPLLATGWIGDATGRPVQGLRVSLFPDGTDGPSLEVDVGGDGTFRLPPHVERSYRATLVIDAPTGYLDVRYPLGDDDELPRIELPTPRRVEGRLIHPLGQAFAPGGRIEIVPAERWVVWQGSPSAVAEDGSFVVDGLPTGQDLLSVVDMGWLASQDLTQLELVTRTPAGQSDVQIRLGPARPVRGHVRGVEGDVSKILVVALPLVGKGTASFGSFDLDGSFVVPVAGVEDWVLVFVDPRGQNTVTIASVPVRAGTTGVEVEHPGLTHITIPSAEVSHVVAYRSGQRREMSSNFLFDDERQLAVLDGSPVDLLLADDAFDATRAAFVRSVAPGSSVTAELRATLPLTGRLGAEPPHGSQLVLAGPSGNFPVLDSDLTFEAAVLDGTYDMVLLERSGAERVVARGLVAGRTDYEVDPR